MRLHSIPVLAGAALTLGGCAHIVTSEDAQTSGVGVAYALPKGQVLLTASRVPIDPSLVAKATQAVADAAKTVNDDATALATATTGGDAAKIAAAKATQTVDKAALDAAKAALTAANAGAMDPTVLGAEIRAIFETARDQKTAQIALEAVPPDDKTKVDAATKVFNDATNSAKAARLTFTAVAASQVSANILATNLDKITGHGRTIAEDIAAVSKATGDALTQAKNKLVADNKTANRDIEKLITASANLTKFQETGTLTLLPIVPDASARYVANLNHNLLRDDTLKLNIANGMLNTSTLTSTDQTAAIAVSIADFAITLGAEGEGGGPEKSGYVEGLRPPPPASCSYSLSMVFNPLDGAQVTEVNQALGRHQAGFRISVPSASQTPAYTDDKRLKPVDLSQSLVYRVATSVVILSSPVDGVLARDAACPIQSLPMAQSIQAIMPDSRSKFAVRQDAGPFTTTNLTVGFSNGMLTDYTAVRPSELAAFWGIFPKVASDIVSIPATIIQARVNLDNAKTALVTADSNLQQARIAQQTVIINARAAVVSAETALLQAELTQPTTVTNARTAGVTAQTNLAQAEIGQSKTIAEAQLAVFQAKQALQKAIDASAAAKPATTP
jgi:hypothetical protein